MYSWFLLQVVLNYYHIRVSGEGSSSNPCSEIYRGPRAFSEVEVDQVARYLKSIPNLKSYYNVHSYGQLVLTPWAYTSSPPQDYSEIVSQNLLIVFCLLYSKIVSQVCFYFFFQPCFSAVSFAFVSLFIYLNSNVEDTQHV